MTRSKNSRKGLRWAQYSRWCKLEGKKCSICNPRRKDKNNIKRNAIKFDGVKYTLVQKGYHYLCSISRIPWKDTYNYRDALKAKLSYKNWTWLKGRANIKGWHCNTRRVILIGNELGRILYPSQ